MNIEREISFFEKRVGSSNTVELLGVTLGKNINFKSHIKNICGKTNNNVRALSQVRNFLTFEQAKVFSKCICVIKI